MDYTNAVPNSSGMFRIYGMFGKYGVTEKPRIWIGVALDGSKKLKADTILKIKDSAGNTDEVLASESGLMFDLIKTKH